MANCRVTAPDSQTAPDVVACAPGAPGDDSFWPAELGFELAVERARTRDAESLRLLYLRFLPAVYRFLLSRVREVALAEDLTSETFVAVMSGITRVRARDEMGFATWVLGIARHKLSQHYRVRQRSREAPLALAETNEPRAFVEERDPLAALIERERWEEVVAALNQLTPEQRFVLFHRLILGRSAEDIAQMMSKQVNAIYGLQFRALASLARHLQLNDNETELPGSAAHQAHERSRKEGRRHGA
ncbi:MAG TPA: sigma-70 family RNA polymerase sigma factor [Ktedonobacterales bacterium]|nr:sigma-70 family RNA polymerase sigma factor [Ktedonobacterales bacterium]